MAKQRHGRHQHGQHRHGEGDGGEIGMLAGMFGVLVQFSDFFAHGIGLLSKLAGGEPGVPARPLHRKTRYASDDL